MFDRAALLARLQKECPLYAQKAIAEMQPCVLFATKQTPECDIPIGATKFGGMPDLAFNVGWPVAVRESEEHPLEFIAQINLADSRAQEVEPNVPRVGLLSFFYDMEEWVGGIYPTDSRFWRVIYTPPGGNLTRRRGTPYSKPPLKACSATSLLTVSLPDVQAPVFSNIKKSDFQQDAYFDIVSSLQSPSGANYCHQLFGHEEIIQHPLAEETVQGISGCFVGSDFNYQIWNSVQNQVKDWRLLMQFAEDAELESIWGDGGLLYYSIRHQDLANEAYDKAWLILQSH